jgi:GTP-binding protein
MSNLIKIFSRECTFVAGAAKVDSIPEIHLPEFAFIGRSNVGKSSLINAILNRKYLARVSQNPGCTKQVNFFNLDNKISIADLPGYGFAKIGNNERNSWNNLIHSYLRGRKRLLRVFLLLDSRHKVKEIDKKTMSFLDDYAISYQIVMTKIDKAIKNEKEEILNNIEIIAKNYVACHPEIILSSSTEKIGIVTLQEIIVNLAESRNQI